MCVQLQDSVFTLMREPSLEIISINSNNANGDTLHDMGKCVFLCAISCVFVSTDMMMEGALNKLC